MARHGRRWLVSVERKPGGLCFARPPTCRTTAFSPSWKIASSSIWVGTADGLARLSAPDVAVLNSRDGLSGDNVSTIYCGPSRHPLVDHRDGRDLPLRHGRVEPVHLPPSAANLRFRGAFEDHNGAFWFGTDNQGVVRLDKGKATRFTIAEGLRNNGIQAFFEDREHNLWIGTTSGLSRWDGTRFQNFYLDQGLSYGWVRAIAEDHNGDMLVGTDRGLNRFHDGGFVTDPAFAALSRDRVWAIYPQSPDTLWIATRGAGLVRVQNGKTARITTREGLLSNSIFQLIGDGRGSLWMSGPLGLSAASIADLNAAADGKSTRSRCSPTEPATVWNPPRSMAEFSRPGVSRPMESCGFPASKARCTSNPGLPAPVTTPRSAWSRCWWMARVFHPAARSRLAPAGGVSKSNLPPAACGPRSASSFGTSWRASIRIGSSPPAAGPHRTTICRPANTVFASLPATDRSTRSPPKPASLCWCGPNLSDRLVLRFCTACLGGRRRRRVSLPGAAGPRPLQSSPGGANPHRARNARHRRAGLRRCFHADRSRRRLRPFRPGSDVGMSGQRPHSPPFDPGRSSPGAIRSAPRLV